MNLQHLKYVVEIEKTGSITKAAENLFMGQPNLSRAVKELEKSLGINIFKRTSKGIAPTTQGKEFIGFAKGIIEQVDEVENLYIKGKKNNQSLSISVPRASYISHAFTNFIRKLSLHDCIDINYKETNNMRAMKNVVEEGYSLGIIRYVNCHKKYFDLFLEEKDLKGKLVSSFKYQVIMSEKHPLANEELELNENDLSRYIEISFGDPFIPSLSTADAKKIDLNQVNDRHVYVYERGSAYELLSEVHDTFMRSSPIPQKMLEKYSLVSKVCESFNNEYEDVMIYRTNHTFTEIEKSFINELYKSVNEILK